MNGSAEALGIDGSSADAGDKVSRENEARKKRSEARGNFKRACKDDVVRLLAA